MGNKLPINTNGYKIPVNGKTIETGRLVGYTGTIGPTMTFYFEKGRYTQVHDKPTNVGWHPADKIVRSNVSKEQAKEIRSLRKNKMNNARAFQQYSEFKKKFYGNAVFRGQLDPGNYNEGNMLYEVSLHIGRYEGHPSRGQLIKDSSTGIHQAFVNLVESGKFKIALNEL